MCGINGIYQIQDLKDPKSLIIGMNKASLHRGPDHTDVFLDANVALGHNRLSVIDIQESSNQPFISEDGKFVLVFNGEIYNFKDIKRILKNYDYQTESDTEVVLAAYQRWGKGCVNHFNGMFSFAVWDVEKETLFIARDRLGIKPLYYYDNLKQFAFSSEVRSLLTLPFIENKINKDALIDYVKYGTVHAPRTIIEGVKVLMPGHYTILDANGIKTVQYWNANLHYSTESYNKPYDIIKSKVKEKFLGAVEKRLVADVPFGAFLSGGIDSSAIVAAMATVSEQKIKTFNISFDESEFSEAKFARQIAKKYNTEHHEIKLTPDDFLTDLPNAILAMDHPSGDGPNSYVVSKATKEAGVTMALSGLGGDELFAGYAIFKRAYSLLDKKWMMSFPLLLRKTLGAGLKMVRPSISSDKIVETLTSKYLELPYYYPVNREVTKDEELAKLMTYYDYPANAVFEILQNGVGIGTYGADVPFLSRVSYSEINTYMQNVLLRDTDQMSMAHALEVRTPFLDHELVQYVWGVRDEVKFPTTPKKLLVEALGDLLPPEIVNRPKMGFTLPWITWMKKDLSSYCEQGLEYLSESGYFNPSELQKLWGKFLKGDYRTPWSKVWQLVVLGHWMKNNKVS